MNQTSDKSEQAMSEINIEAHHDDDFKGCQIATWSQIFNI